MQCEKFATFSSGEAKKQAERAARRLLVAVRGWWFGSENTHPLNSMFVYEWQGRCFVSSIAGLHAETFLVLPLSNGGYLMRLFHVPLLWQGKAEKEKADKAWTVARLDWHGLTNLRTSRNVSRYFNRDIWREGDFSTVGEFQQNVFCCGRISRGVLFHAARTFSKYRLTPLLCVCLSRSCGGRAKSFQM